MPSSQSSHFHIAALVVLAVLALGALVCSACALGVGGLLLLFPSEPAGLPGDSGHAEKAPTPEVVTTPAPESAYSTLDALDQTIIPQRNRLELAVRLRGLSPDEIAPPEPKIYNLGDTEKFWVDNSDTDEVSQVTAVLRYVTPHVYMWVEEGVDYDQEGLAASAERFETHTYPTNHHYFGTESSPGVDGDVHLHILNTRSEATGYTLVGYFLSHHQYPAEVALYSNEREMFFINVDYAPPGGDYYDSVLAHEFQHMIHWNVDQDEDTWVNEGLSELAELLNGYDEDSVSTSWFVANSDVQLTDWPEGGGSKADYGGSFLFHAYFLDRFGDEALRALVRNPRNGMDGLEDTLRELGETDPLSGGAITAEDFFADWVVANFVNDPALGDGRYAYSLLPGFDYEAPGAISRLPVADTGSVHQFGADYIQVPSAGRLRVTFDGSQQVRLLPTDTGDTDGDPDTGDRFVWWSNRGDDSDMTLTTRLDLTAVSSATLEYDAWYLIEEGWDYAYVMVSEDDGQTWTVLEAPHTTTLDPHGTSYGPGYTGSSADRPGANREGWLRERVDLSAYAGREILLRFEMITDDAVNRPGLLLDNVRVDAIGFYDDAEEGNGLWQAEGFVRHDNVLPQTYVVQVLALGKTPLLERLELDADNHGELLFEPGPGASQVVLAVSGLTPHTSEVTGYSYSVAAE